MKVTIIYFSQTENTRTVAETMAEAFLEAGHATRVICMRKATIQDAVTADLLGVGSPCYSSQAPTPVKAFLHSLPRLEQKRAFVFATCSGAPGRVLYDMTHLLQSKGGEVIGGFLARGECHHPAPCLVGRFSNRPDGKDLTRARLFAVAVSEQVSFGRSGLVAESSPDTMKPQGNFYNAVALLSTDKFLRSFSPEPKLVTAQCDQCQWCVDECPMNNITLQPYPVLGKKCIRCYHCLTGCPQKAFEVDWRLSNLGVGMFYNTIFERWFGDVKAGEKIYPE